MDMIINISTNPFPLILQVVIKYASGVPIRTVNAVTQTVSLKLFFSAPK